MAREKRTAVQRTPSQLLVQSNGVVLENGDLSKSAPAAPADAPKAAKGKPAEAGLVTLLICVAGIYASLYVPRLESTGADIRSLTWAVAQERITTTAYGPPSKPEKFAYPVFLNTVYSSLAALSGLAYLYTSTSHPLKPGRPAPIFPSLAILPPLLLVSVTSSLSSPFGYAALSHIDYITFILAKSCKLLPVMALHLTVFRKSYPLYKYGVVALVTLGVAVFTLHHPSTAKQASKHLAKVAGGVEPNRVWGLFLLGVNLLFDGLFNSTQDYIFASFAPYSGPQMMCAQNLLSTALTVTYLVAAPLVAPTALGRLLSLPRENEVAAALSFVRRHPQAWTDVMLFCACGAVGQVFIFHTLATFSSLVLVTVNVTRKMLTMVLSVLWFGHRISPMQWLGVGLVFGGVGGEAVWGRREKQLREKRAREAEAKKDR
jgi:UDP-galactose transporter B1